MASRYWVGGAATWDGTAGTKWALTSGGAGGQAVPTSSDDVFFDAASGAVTVTVSSATCANLDFTGFTGTLGGSAVITCAGSLILSTGMTHSKTGGYTFTSTTTGRTITTNGKDVGGTVTFNGAGGEWTLQDALLTTSGSITLTQGSLNTNSYAVTAPTFASNNSNTRSLSLGASVVTLTGATTAWNLITTTNLTFNAGVSTLKLTSTSALIFEGGGKTYGTLWLDRGSATTSVTITGSNTFSTFRNSGTGNHAVKFTSASTTTIAELLKDGTSTITLESSTPGNVWNLIYTGSAITLNNLSIRDSNLTGSIVAANSTNTSGNTGWIFASTTAADMKVRGFFLMANRAIT